MVSNDRTIIKEGTSKEAEESARGLVWQYRNLSGEPEKNYERPTQISLLRGQDWNGAPLEQVKKFCSLSQLTPEVVDIYQILRAGLSENKTRINIGCIEKEN